jgi:hypothetical protein
MLKRNSTRHPPAGVAIAERQARQRSFHFNFGGIDTFANAGIEGLFANIGFSGLWDLRFALGACGQMGGEGQIGSIGKRRGEMPARVVARPVPSIGAGNERQW